MKIRAKKGKKNTTYEFVDFLLREFSKDKVEYIHDDELSCNECQDVEDVENYTDSIKSFLVKLKADILSDPSAVRSGVQGFILPEEFDYELMKVPSFFKSITENHYNLKTTKEKLKEIAAKIYSDKSLQIEFSKDEVNSYLLASYKQGDWDLLLNDGKKTKWQKHAGKLLKKNLVDNYGKVDSTSVAEALKIDRAGYIEKSKEINKYGGFNNIEIGHLAPYL